MDSDGSLGPFHLKVGALHWLLPALLSAALISSSHRSASAQEAAPSDDQAQTANDAAPTPIRGLVAGPSQPARDTVGLGSDVLGIAPVRRTFTAPADGWYRLAARGPGGGWVVTVVDPDAGDVLASSRWEDDPDGGALVHARAGAGLAVLVGTLDGRGGGFDLEWSRAPVPVRLRHAGRLVDGGPDARGVPVEIRGAGDLSFGAGKLYLASALGLSEFERDAASGGLAFVRLVDADVTDAYLAWDAGRARLLAHDCGTWTAFERHGDGGVGPPRDLAAVGDQAHCGRLLVDAAGDLVHRVGASGVDTFAVLGDGALRFEGTTPMLGLKGAVLGPAGRLYAAAEDALWVIRARDAAARFTAVPTGVGLATSSLARVPLAVDADGGRLLAVDAAGVRLFALEHAPLDGPTVPTELPATGADGTDGAGCSFAAMRPDATVDLICAGGVVTARWFEGSRVFGDARRVGGVPDFGTPVGTAATPDGRHVYVSTRAHGILAFERLVTDDHGDDPASATPVTIPSTTAGEIGAGDKDYFRIDVVVAGFLTFETTGSTDTYGTLYDSDGTVIDEDNDRGPRPNNFRITNALVFEGSYFLDVRGASPSRDTGAYDLRVTGDARGPGTPAATAPAVTIDAIPSGNEETAVRLGATLTGGAYDGAAEYAWSVTGGTLDDDGLAAPTWTRPAVTSNTNHTVGLTVTVRGTGTNAESGTSDTTSASGDALVRDVPPPPPAAAAPTVSINAIAAGDEGTTVRLGATLVGGTYDGALEYAWTVDAGRLANAASATPTWTRPTVSADTDYTVRLTVTARGRGTAAQRGSSARATANRAARVLDVAQLPVAAAPSVSIDAIAAGDEGTTVTLGATLDGGTHDGAVAYQWSVDGGALDNANLAAPTWTRPTVASNTNHTVRLTITARGSGTRARNGTSDTASASRSAQVGNVVSPLPVPSAPSVTINAVAAGDENTAVTLGATLDGGTYDGTPEYAWTVDGGTLDNRNAAAPTWTRPTVTSNTNYTIRLTVTAHGTGTRARNGTSDTGSASRSAQVRDVTAVLPVAAAPSVSIDAIADGDEGTPVTLGATLDGGTYDGAAEYAWSANVGTVANPNSATPTWTRPSVVSTRNHTVSLRVTVRGSGTVARNGTSATANASRTALVRDVTAVLPVANPPTVRINNIPAGDEGTTVQLGAMTYGGNYDGAPTYEWTVSGGTLDNPNYALPIWTRPAVTADTNVTVSATVTVRGAGRNARSGTSVLRTATKQARVVDAGSSQVRNVGDHGNDRASATTVGAPSTTAGTLTRGDRDWFRIDITQAGSLRLEATGTTDTYGTLYRADGTRLASNDDDGARLNFLISMAAVGTGTYYLEVRGYRTYTTGAYSMEVSGTARGQATPPSATAPSVTINAVAAGDENTAVTLGATLVGGTYDGTPDYAWSVSGGTLDDETAAAPTWTRPAVTSDANHTVGLTVTVDGDGTKASTGSSDTASTSRTALVRNVAVQMPAAEAPSVTINTVPAGNEGTTVQLGAALTGGTYEGAVESEWSVNGGTLDDDSLAAPTWTRPTVQSDMSITVILGVTVRGRGTTVRTGTFDISSTSRTTRVLDVPAQLPVAAAPSVSINAIAAGNENTTVPLGATLDGGTYDGAAEYAWSVDGGTLDDPAAATPTWTRPSVTSNKGYTIRLTVTARGTGTNARSGTSDTANASRSSQVRNVGGGDHGDDRASATTVGAPSTTAGTLTRGDRDWFRIDITQAGSLRLEATGTTDTYGTLYRADGTRLARNDDDGDRLNFLISMAAVGTGTYYLEVRGYRTYTTGAYSLKVSGTARGQASPPSATAPSVTINAVAAGDENTAVTLGATLVGGTYDGTPDYAWSVSGGALDDETAATPTWTRPAVTSDANHTVGLTVTVGGDGTKASTGSSDTASTSRTAQVRDVPAQLPTAVAPSVSINAIPAGDEGTDVRLGAALTGGTYEGAVEYRWSVDSGALDNPNAASPTWTRPTVSSDTDHTVGLVVAVHGRGTTVRSGTSATANTSRSAQVRNVVTPLPDAVAPSVSINAIAAGDEGTDVQLGTAMTGGTYEGAVAYRWSVDGGVLDNPNAASPTWTRPTVASDTNHTVGLGVTVYGSGTTVRSGTSATANTSRSAQVRNNTGVLPAAAAPAVSINAIADGDEGAGVQLSAAMTGGDYDGTPEYAWSATGGTLADPNSATPTWTRPRVASDTHHTVRLTVTVRGIGTAALDGTSDTQSASSSTQVRDTGGTGDDHGNTRADASPVSIPSTTVAELGRSDRDYYRIEVGHAGSLRLQTRGHTDTVGTLRRSNGAAIASNDDGGQRQNFHIFRNSVGVGVYYVEVRGYSNAVRGDYTFEVTGTARGANSLPSAVAPSVSVNTIADGNEGATVQLGATLVGGTYDGAVEYAWAVDGGTLDDSTLATPTWTRPAVSSDTNHTASLIVTVHGTGTNAASGSSATANASRTALVRNIATPLPEAAAPSVSIDAIAVGDEGTTVTLGATLAGGTYDGAAEYAWSVDGGTISNPNSAAPTWTRPSVTSNTNYTVRLTVTVRGSGTVARNGTSATANAPRTAQVLDVASARATAPSVSINAIAAGDEGTSVTLGAALTGGTYDGAAEYAWSVNGGTISNPSSATPTWIRPSVASTRNYTVSLRVTVRGSGTVARNGTSATANATRTTQVRNVTAGLPAASAPSVSINAIAAGDEGTGVSLSATLTGGRYDGAAAYIWNVNGGTLANRHTATPTWARPSVESTTNYTVRLRVIVDGSGTNARSDTFAVANTTRTAQVRDVASALPVASAPNAVIDYIPGGVGNTTVQLGVKLTGGTYDGPPEYAWESDECVLDDATVAAPVCTRIPVPDNDLLSTWGIANVTVTVRGTGTNARDGTVDTDRAARQFSVRPIDDPTPWDDHANGSKDATLVTMPGTMAGSLETAGDIDWFYFRLTSAAEVLVETTGSTDTAGSLHFFDRRPIADDGRGPGGNMRIVADLEPGYVLVEVGGQDRLATGDYTLVLKPRPANAPPTLVAGSLPSAPQAIAGGAPRIFPLDEPFTDPDGDFVWLSLSSDNESVATAALQGKALVIHPDTAGTANITVTGHDPSGASASGSFAVTVSAPTRTDPTASFNVAGDQLTLSFTDQFAPGETRAYQAFVRQKPSTDGWNRFCFTASNSGNSTQTQSVSTDLAVTGIVEPGVTYETKYRHRGSSCSDSGNGLWSRAVEATAPGTPSFDIDLVFLGTPSAAHRRLVETAAARWERILTMDVPNVDLSENPLSGDNCMSGAPRVDDVVDDLRVFVDIKSIDGPGGTLGSAGACWVRNRSRIPFIGGMILDADDFQGSTSRLETLVLHELAHALGFGFSHWSRSNLLREPSIRPDGSQRYGTHDTHFAGPLAVAAFNAAGGTSYSGGKVPVSNNIGWESGTRNSHWRESAMDHELMTPNLEQSGSHPLSAITIQAMADMGYQVDASQADAYRLPSAGTSVAAAPARSAAPALGPMQAGATGQAQGATGQGQGQTDAATISEACIVMDNAIAIDGDQGVMRILPSSAVRTTRVVAQ